MVGKELKPKHLQEKVWLIFGYVLGSVFVAQPSKVCRDRQKTWQRREKNQATWKDNKYQQTKKEMERATRSKRKTNVTILWWICWSWSPQKLNSLGSCWFPLWVRRPHPVDTAGWWRRAWPGGAYGETKCGHQSRFSPKTSKWHIFAFTKCKGKLGSLNLFKSRFFLLVFFAVHFLQQNAHSGSKLVFGFLESGMQKKHQSRFNSSLLGKTFTKCH